METPRCLLLRTSVYHGSTARVAGAIAGVLGADVAAPEAVPSTNLASCDLRGIGSGVFSGRMHEALFAWLRGGVSHEEPTACDMHEERRRP